MCGLKASDVGEELVSAAARAAEQDLVYGEIKPAASGGFFATSASELGLAGRPEAPVGRMHCWLPGEGEGEGEGGEQPGPGPGAPCCMAHPVLTCHLQCGQEAHAYATHSPTSRLEHPHGLFEARDTEVRKRSVSR